MKLRFLLMIFLITISVGNSFGELCEFNSGEDEK